MATGEIDLDDIEADIMNSMSADDRQTSAEYQAGCEALQLLLGHTRGLRAELEALKAPPVYPSVVKFPDLETPQNVMQPSREVWLEVEASGFANRIWDCESPRWWYSRKVRYVLAPPESASPTGEKDGE